MPILDNDFYAFTMGAVIHKNWPGYNVRYEFKNRGPNFFVDPEELNERIRQLQNEKITQDEIDYLRSLDLFDSEYLEFLSTVSLPDVDTGVRWQDGGLTLSYEGPWASAILWETPLLALISEMYLEKKRQPGEKRAVFNEGHIKLFNKIQQLKKYPEIKFMEFGARRRYSREWQNVVVGRLANEIPDQLIGTSNVDLARKYGIPTVGTMAHQLFMVTAAQHKAAGWPNPIRSSADECLTRWSTYYHQKLLVALTDTFTTDYFLHWLTWSNAVKFGALRQDSGDPFVVGEKIVDFYNKIGIDPQTKTIVFSDGLDVPRVIDLYERFSDRIDVSFGIGTSISNDLGVQPLQIVIKPVSVDGTPCVKLSDNPEKASGPVDEVDFYKKLVDSDRI